MNDVIQVRVGEQLKKEATLVFETYGLDLSTAIRLFLKETVLRKALPLSMDEIKHREEFDKALASIQKDAKERKLDKLTDEEINKVIEEVRREKKTKK